MLYILVKLIINFIFKGGDQNEAKLDDILMYSNTNQNWTRLGQKMQAPRSGHAVSIIDYSLTICGNTK